MTPAHHANARKRLSNAMRSVLERMDRAGHMPMHGLTPQQARAAYAAGAGVLDISPPHLTRVQELHFLARDGAQLTARLFAPSYDVLPALLYFHGGGFTIGNVDTHDTLCRRISELAHCAVISVNYRLAPEHQFPTACEDAFDAMQWVRKASAGLGLDPHRLAVGGDSAGGTLAAVCAVQARNTGVPLALQLLFYPGCSSHQETASHHLYEKGFVLEAAHIRYFFGHYLRTDADRSDWRFSPLEGKTASGETLDFTGVASAWFGLAECDPLVDEGVQLADRMRHAGVAVDLEIYRGVTHEFIKMGRAIPEALQAHADAAAALRGAFAVG